MTNMPVSPELDESVRPQDDFFGYVNNKWLASNPLPDSEAYWGVTSTLRDTAYGRMRDIYESLQTDASESGIKQQARDFYKSGMDYDKYKAAHIEALQIYVSQIDAAKTSKDISKVVGALHRIGVNVPWSMVIDADHEDSSRYLVRLHQAGLSMPDRDYYLSQDESMQKVREKYDRYIKSVHGLFTHFDISANQLSKLVLDMETQLAKKQRPNAKLRDVDANYNPTTIQELSDKYPQIDWEAYAGAANWQFRMYISHDQPEFLEYINQKIEKLDLSDWKNYLKWHVSRTFLPYISKEAFQVHFDFYGRVINGTKEPLPRWKIVVLTMERAMGEPLGKLYIDRHFPEESKKEVLDLVEMIREAFHARIDRLEWMGDKTKEYAHKKLNNMKVLVGFPDEWKDFSKLEISHDSFLANIIESEIFRHDFAMQRLDQKISKDEWYMSPQTVNAYHDPNQLVICFPAGILQYPFFDSRASIAQNLGGIGTVIGHELTHGFDDQGSQFDAEGNVRIWQTTQERKEFNKKAQMIVEQANQHEVLPGVTLNGKLVLGEAIADLGGVELAVEALKQTKSYTQDSLVNLFVNYTHTEAQNIRDEKAKEYALIDPHPDCRFRSNAILEHVDSFYETFKVEPGDKLYREKENRAKIW